MIDAELEKISSKLQEIKPKDKYRENIDNNIEKFKVIKKLFKEKFGFLVDEIEKLPEELSKIVEQVEDSPASIKQTMTWEWIYHDKTSKRFNQNFEIYSLDANQGYTSILAYSSHSVNHEDTKFVVKFHDTTNFGCSGFGLMSKNQTEFIDGNFSTGNFPLICLCCTGPWSAKRVNKKVTDNLQYILKRASDKTLIFELDFSSMLFKVTDCEGNDWGDYDLNLLPNKEDLVLIFYSGSSVTHSHEIILD